jgi:hypothetical protein
MLECVHRNNETASDVLGDSVHLGMITLEDSNDIVRPFIFSKVHSKPSVRLTCGNDSDREN